MDERVIKGKPLVVQPSITLTDLMDRFSTEDACKAYLRDSRWPNGVVCPRCGNEKVYTLKQPFKWQCQSGKVTTDPKGKQVTCKSYRFSVTTGSIFENTKYPLRQWFQVAYLICQSKKGISALQIHRQIKSGDYRTAWYMCMRIRAAMRGEIFPLAGEVEVDETYVGGKETNKHLGKRGNMGTKGKTEVIGAIARKGNVVCQMVEDADFATYDDFVRKAVSSNVSLVATDESHHYRHLRRMGFPHDTVTHSRKEYVRGEIHTQTIDSFWSLLKRGIMGSYHQVSRDYLPLYLNEFSWRYNNRKNPDIFADLLSSV
jgi:transposase-like protein